LLYQREHAFQRQLPARRPSLQRSPHNLQSSSNEHGAIIDVASLCLEQANNAGEDGCEAHDVSSHEEVVPWWRKSTHVANHFVTRVLGESWSG
jgi:hypothetical protein